MTGTITLPIWAFILILLFAAVTFASHFLFPSVRWFFRRRLERAVARLNTRLTRPIEPFKLARRYDMIQRLSYDPEVSQAIAEHAKAEGVPENVAFQDAQRYAREIVPSFSAFTYFGLGIRIARWLGTLLYDVKTPPSNEKVLEPISPDATVVFVMNHRSNTDYVLVTYLAAQASALSYAVGEWARVWPLSRLIKSMGAYFIRRKSRNALYRKVLARYVQLATKGGVTQAVFPEGGLSLDGQLMPPKMGILAYILDAWEPDGRDIAFVPVAINYDRVLEDRVLIAAHKRGDRRFGAKISVIASFILEKIWLKLRGRYTGFGTAAVVFGSPVLMSGYKTRPDLDGLANDLMARIKDNMPVLGVPLMATVFLNAQAPLTQAEAIEAGKALLTKMNSAGAISGDPDKILAGAINQMAQRHMIEEGTQGWSARSEEHDVMAFYANTVAHAIEGQAPVLIAARAKS
ncbi:MAG: 1-acyl-sn-glycerol-3-phosphate acyltransferase [Rhodobacteraceae bacterium]|nr:1-acyl-sn-glycerol-3-phosphate acyltransferase [Paracoccaceae bacterium]